MGGKLPWIVAGILVAVPAGVLVCVALIRPGAETPTREPEEPALPASSPVDHDPEADRLVIELMRAETFDAALDRVEALGRTAEEPCRGAYARPESPHNRVYLAGALAGIGASVEEADTDFPKLRVRARKGKDTQMQVGGLTTMIAGTVIGGGSGDSAVHAERSDSPRPRLACRRCSQAAPCRHQASPGGSSEDAR